MNSLLQILGFFIACFPAPVGFVISLGIFIAILVMLLKLIKLILDAIPFV